MAPPVQYWKSRQRMECGEALAAFRYDKAKRGATKLLNVTTAPTLLIGFLITQSGERLAALHTLPRQSKA